MRERGEATTDSPCPKTPTLIHSHVKTKLELTDLRVFLPYFAEQSFATRNSSTLTALALARCDGGAGVNSMGPKYVQAPTRHVFKRFVD